MNKPFSILLILLALCISASAQIDSLETKSYKELIGLIESYRSPSTLNILSYYIKKAETEENALELFNGYSRKAETLIWTRKFPEAAQAASIADSIAIANQITTDYTTAKYLQGKAYFFQAVLSKSVEAYDAALALAKEQNDVRFQITTSNQIGYIKSFIGDHEGATKILLKSLRSSDAVQIDPELGIDANYINALKLETNYYLSRSYISQEKGDSAFIFIENVLRSTAISDSCSSKNYYRTRAEAELLKGDKKAALSSLEKSKTVCRPLINVDTFMMNKVYAELFLKDKEYSKAAIYLQEALDSYGEVQEAEEGFMDTYYKSLAIAYKHTGNLEKSNEYLEKYIGTTDAFIKIQDSVSSSFKQQEVASFKKELASITSEKDQEKNYRNYILLGATIIILLLLFLLLKFYQRKKKNEVKFKALVDKMQSTTDEKEIVSSSIISSEPTTTDIPEAIKNQILDGLQKLEKQEYFLQQECSSYTIAKKLQTNTTYLSKTVNASFGKNFNGYINDLRINYAIVRLKDDVIFRSYSIQSIAEELGYKSADSFTKYFKKHTGLNPSFYIKEIKNLT